MTPVRSGLDERGFTLVELLLVAVLGAVIVMAMYEVLATNQRTFTVQNASTGVQQTLRAGASVLYGELREVSPREGDLVEMSDDELRIRTMEEFGYVCADPASSSPNATLPVRELGRSLQVGDSVVVFKENDSRTPEDDAWDTGEVTGWSMDGVSCLEDGANVEVPSVTIQGVAHGAPPDSILRGAPVRAFVHRTYRLGQIDSEWFLVRAQGDGAAEPLVGPLDANDGLRFVYLDEDENETADLDEVRQIEVTLRRITEARRPGGGFVGDSLSLRIYPRN